MSGRKYLEQLVESQLSKSGYRFVEKLKHEQLARLQSPAYAKKVRIGKDVFGRNRDAHYLLFHPRKWPKGLVIELRWQSKSGTVDQKFPFIVMTIKRSGLETIMVVGGENLKPEAANWLANQIGYRLIEVFNPQEFQVWVNQGNI